MKRVLFVDDEQQILDGLQNLLRKQRKEWEMVFALGGQNGLEEIAKARFDVVVSDMRMPGLDGAAFLGKVREIDPGAVRIVLSGHAEKDMLMRVVPVAHQFLSKPCDAARLKAVVERVCSVQSRSSSECMRAIVGKLDKLPSVPEIYHKLISVLNSPGNGIPEVSEVVEQDPSISLKLLQLVNSAFFGLPMRVSSVQQAVGYLGVELVKGLVLTAHIMCDEGRTTITGLSCRELQESALLTAKLARAFLGKGERVGDAFTAALLHDIGKVVLLQALPERYERVIALAAASNRPVHALEREEFGVTHAEIGAHLLGVWGLPFEIMEAVCHHHAPSLVGDGDVGLLAVVHVADAYADQSCQPGAGNPEDVLDMEFLERSGFRDKLPAWSEVAARTIASVASNA